MRRLILIVVLVIIVALGLSFAMLNTEDAPLNYYFGQASLPMSVWMVIGLIMGAVLGALSTMGVVWRQRRELSRLRRRVNESQKEVSELRKLPIRNTT